MDRSVYISVLGSQSSLNPHEDAWALKLPITAITRDYGAYGDPVALLHRPSHKRPHILLQLSQ
jgi:hypothetical protein